MVSIDRQGRVNLEELAELLRRDTVLVTISAVDSELGVVQPVREIARMLEAYPHCRLHVDATQAVGKIPISFQYADTMSLAAHKFYGLNGVGLLLRREDVGMEPLDPWRRERVALSKRHAARRFGRGDGNGAGNRVE